MSTEPVRSTWLRISDARLNSACRSSRANCFTDRTWRRVKAGGSAATGSIAPGSPREARSERHEAPVLRGGLDRGRGARSSLGEKGCEKDPSRAREKLPREAGTRGPVIETSRPSGIENSEPSRKTEWPLMTTRWMAPPTALAGEGGPRRRSARRGREDGSSVNLDLDVGLGLLGQAEDGARVLAQADSNVLEGELASRDSSEQKGSVSSTPDAAEMVWPRATPSS